MRVYELVTTWLVLHGTKHAQYITVFHPVVMADVCKVLLVPLAGVCKVTLYASAGFLKVFLAPVAGVCKVNKYL